MKIKLLVGLCLFFMIITACCACGRGKAPNSVFSPDDLAGKKVGAIEGSAALIRAEELEYDDVTVQSYDTASLALTALKDGVADCLMVDSKDADKMLSKSIGIIKLENGLEDVEWGFAVARENADLTKAINKAIGKLSESGVIDSIIDSYTEGSDYRYEPKPDDKYTAVLTMETTADSRPFCFTEDGEIRGLDADIARAVCDELQVRLEIKTAERDSILTDVQKGRVSFAAGRMTKESEDGDKVDFTNAYFTASQKILVRK